MIAQTGRTYLLKVLNLNIIGPGLIPLKLRMIFYITNLRVMLEIK
jgi:hypothetical protein